MELELVRETFTTKSTIGEFSIDGAYHSWSLEDPVRDGPKIKGRTAIPYGRYKVVRTWSPRFKRMAPLLVGVPGFEGVRIHAGNTPDDTEGCILLGFERGVDEILESRQATMSADAYIKEALERGEEVWITIRRAAA